MNQGRLNHRIKFTQSTSSDPDEFGGVNYSHVELLTTWGSLEPVTAHNQTAIEAGASVLNQDKILIIRYRDGFTPAKDMEFEDLNNPGDIYRVLGIVPYYEKAGNVRNNQRVYKDKEFIQMIGIKKK